MKTNLFGNSDINLLCAKPILNIYIVDSLSDLNLNCGRNKIFRPYKFDINKISLEKFRVVCPNNLKLREDNHKLLQALSEKMAVSLENVELPLMFGREDIVLSCISFRDNLDNSFTYQYVLDQVD